MAKPRRRRSASRSSSRSPSRSASSGSSSSRSRSRSFSSSSSSPSRGRSPPAAKGSSPGARRGRSPSPPAKRGSPSKKGRSPSPPPKKASPPRKTSPAPESVVLHIDRLSRNVNEAHLKEIFGNFGEVVNVELSMDRMVNLPRGYGYIEFKKRTDAEKALLYMDGGQIDGNVVKLRFTLAPRQRAPSPMKAPPPPPPKRDVPNDKGATSAEKDAQQRRERSQLHLHARGLLQTEGLNHPGVNLIPLLGDVLILHLFVIKQILRLSGVATHLVADPYLQLEDVLSLRHLEGCGHHHLQGDQEALQEGHHLHVGVVVLLRLVVPLTHGPDQFLLEVAGEDLQGGVEGTEKGIKEPQPPKA
uniref:RRM domain-containing protein n=1 Tax=Leersia perrieri TaxID=77586 RepID=A0A0D9VAI8_9ORYZ